MKLYRPTPDQAPFALRAMKMVASAAEHGLGQPQLALMKAAQHVILHTEVDLTNLTPITPEELAGHFTVSELRHQLIQGMVMMSLVEGPSSPEQVKLIESFSKALQVNEPSVKAIHELADHHLLMFRLDFYRRSHMRAAIESTYRTQGGIMGVAKALLGFKGLVEDKELAAKFRALGDLPEDTLGYQFFRHNVDNGFAFPGEPQGFPYGGVYHDFAHVLSGNPATPEGELLVASFMAGFSKSENAFFTILFAVLIQTAGINMAPVDQPVMLGRIGQGNIAENMMKELERGSKMNTDLGADWDFWPYVSLTMDEAKEKLGIGPRDY